MQEFYLADYQDEENEPISHQDISESTHTEKHIIITGWSEKDWNSLNNSFSAAFSFCGTYQLSNSRCDFYCLDIWLGAGDDDISGILINPLRRLLECCLECFNNYINIALAYKFIKKENGIDDVKISYYYQTRVTGNELEHQIKIIRTELGKPVHQNINNAHVYKDISNQYFSPGMELVSGDRIGNSVLKDLICSINKTILFFELPFNVLSNTFHLYHHPKNSFPLPILLKQLGDISYEELWKSQDWGAEYEDYIPKTPVFGYYSSHDEDGCNGPHIVLCPENIKNAVEQAEAVKQAKEDINPEIDEQLLYQIVLIHELAHAMMDKNHVSLNSLFSRAMEESLANMITLQWFEKFDHSNYEKVESFINTQPEIYKFGINQFKACVNWEKWRDSAKDMDGKLKDWFDTCFEGGKIRDIGSEVVRSAYDLIFNKD